MSEKEFSMEHLVQYYSDLDVDKIYIKVLSANDNSKNQVYFGPGFEAATLFPMGDIIPDQNKKEMTFKSSLDFQWIANNRSLVSAPCAQIILYPQYPEIRFSGFLKGTDRSLMDPISNLMKSRLEERVLFLGIDKVGRIIGSVFAPDSPVGREFNTIRKQLKKVTTIFFEIITSVFLLKQPDPRTLLLQELRRIHRLGWINSKRLDSSGGVINCTAPQCGGYTLEAELGITPNGISEPDFHGWEVKQHGGRVLTLFTPEPTGGVYVTQGIEDFIETYGYKDKKIPYRMNFGGTHYCNKPHPKTNLTLKINGFDCSKKKITDTRGSIGLEDKKGEVAASWNFSKILEHWNRKHQRTVFVPSQHQINPNQYRFGKDVLLGEGADPIRLLTALCLGKVYYDPGIKMENTNTHPPKIKKRSQFRINLKNLNDLYNTITTEDVTKY